MKDEKRKQQFLEYFKKIIIKYSTKKNSLYNLNNISEQLKNYNPVLNDKKELISLFIKNINLILKN